MKIGPAAFAFLLIGCSQSHSRMMPLEQGNTWTYAYNSTYEEVVAEVRVSRKVAVGPVYGWELSSLMGESHLAWQGSELIAAQMAGTRFQPPIPIYASESTSWAGTAITNGEEYSARATLTVSEETLDVGGTRHETIKTTLDIDIAGEPLQLMTWFARDIGIVRQEQRRGTPLTFDHSIEFLSGP
ncbi:MAG: hypothetical protein IH944_07430 [Armatimonadetes bacterium]|nr:hypothetical protein [Armatimonadota bacterium]